jgi:hypothetical protein
MSSKNYLLKNRLSEVLALIQVLALDKHGHRSEAGLQKELSEKPESAVSWQQLAKEHQEFFRVDDTKEQGISLVARHVIEINENGIRELSAEFTKKLIETAIELYGIQKERVSNWKVWIPVIAVVIASAASILVTLLHNGSVEHGCIILKP